jgi:hypothetical protein
MEAQGEEHVVKRMIRMRGGSAVDGMLAVACMVVIGLIAQRAFAAGTDCKTTVNVNTKAVSCSNAQCKADDPESRCVPWGVGPGMAGFHQNVYAVTDWTYTPPVPDKPGKPGKPAKWTKGATHLPGTVQIRHCGCKSGHGSNATISTNACCNMAVRRLPDGTKGLATYGECEEPDCPPADATCTPGTVGNGGFLAQAECKN